MNNRTINRLKRSYEEAKECNAGRCFIDTDDLAKVISCIDRVQELEWEFQKVKVMLGGAIEKAEELKKENAELRKQPEIIHCAECKYFTNLNDDEFALCDRAFTGMYVDADGSGFCKWAERRTDGKTN